MTSWIGKRVEMIYISADGELTQRRIKVLSVEQDRIRAYCYAAAAPRIFKRSNILAMQPVRETVRHAR